MKKKSTSLAAKLVLIVLSVLVASTAIIGVFSFTLNRRDAVRLNAERALSIARAVADAVDPEDFAEAMSSGEKNDAWHSFKAFIDKVSTKNDLFYLYVVSSEYGAEVKYYAEGFSNHNEEAEIDLWETDAVDAYSELFFDTMDNARENTTDIYNSEGYGYMVSGFCPVFDAKGAVIGGVGVDIGVDDVVASSSRFGLIIIAIAVVLCVLMAIFFTWYIRLRIGAPVSALTKAADSISRGDIEVSLRAHSNDELGALVSSFQNMVLSTREQVSALELLADGDLTADIQPRSDKDVMGFALQKLIDNLNNMFSTLNSGTAQVSLVSRQIANGAQSLAEGATDQAATMERLSQSVSAMADKTRQNAERADQAASLAETIKASAEMSSNQMELMLNAVRDIDKSSDSINKVIKVIDDIAFQTKILALNAAIEAARAGANGKEFAVVAEEVRTLAQKSADSARDTGVLIIDSMEKTRLGVKIAQDTAVSLSEIVEGINESSRLVTEIAKSSGEQSAEISEINKGVEQVGHVTQQNSATSEESAAASQEMSGQAAVLEGLVSQFRLKGQENKRLSGH